MNRLATVWLLLSLAPSVGAAQEQDDATPAVDEIVRKMVEADRARRESFTGYTAIRQYSVENKRFRVRATMKVQVTVDRQGGKQFKVLEMTGPGAVRRLVFQRMLDTETRASTKAGQSETKIAAENYTFRGGTAEMLNGRKSYVLEAEPKSRSPLLFSGKVWVDAEQMAVVRIEGSPAQNPSFWVRKTQFVHEYGNVGDQWLAMVNRSLTEVRIFGRTTVEIHYTDYRMREPEPKTGGDGHTQ